MPATLVDLDQRERAVERTATGADGRAGPWPGCLPAPSPATVFDDPLPLDVLDVHGQVVRVSGRGTVTADPAGIRLLLGSEAEGWRRGPMRAVRSWAGPWPVDQHWWEPDRHRRLARFQMLVDDEKVGERAHLVIAEHQRWFLLATYD